MRFSLSSLFAVVLSGSAIAQSAEQRIQDMIKLPDTASGSPVIDDKFRPEIDCKRGQGFDKAMRDLSKPAIANKCRQFWSEQERLPTQTQPRSSEAHADGQKTEKLIALVKERSARAGSSFSSVPARFDAKAAEQCVIDFFISNATASAQFAGLSNSILNSGLPNPQGSQALFAASYVRKISISDCGADGVCRVNLVAGLVSLDGDKVADRELASQAQRWLFSGSGSSMSCFKK